METFWICLIVTRLGSTGISSILHLWTLTEKLIQFLSLWIYFKLWRLNAWHSLKQIGSWLVCMCSKFLYRDAHIWICKVWWKLSMCQTAFTVKYCASDNAYDGKDVLRRRWQSDKIVCFLNLLKCHYYPIKTMNKFCVNQWSYLGCQTSDSASNSKFHQFTLLVALVSYSSNFYHWHLWR